jgi:hypothetical protein
MFIRYIDVTQWGTQIIRQIIRPKGHFRQNNTIIYIKNDINKLSILFFDQKLYTPTIMSYYYIKNLTQTQNYLYV